MNLFTWVKTKATEYFKKTALSAVIYAEQWLGSNSGIAKKELAIDFLLSKLPIYLKPFAPLLKNGLVEIADKIIEKAVQELHEIQNKTGVLTV